MLIGEAQIPQATVIIDYDNVFPKKIEDYSKEEIETILKDILLESLNDLSNVSDVIVRLYGGWYTSGVYTARASILQQKLATLNVFPIIRPAERVYIRGRIELATSLIAIPSINWDNTVVERNGIRQIRIDHDNLTQSCTDHPAICPIKILHKFTKSKNKVCSVSSCATVQNTVFKESAQKMVDNMIACDYLSLCATNNAKIIIVVSDDTDHFPSYVLGSSISASGKKIIINFTNKTYLQNWAPFFSQMNNITIKATDYDEN